MDPRVRQVAMGKAEAPHTMEEGCIFICTGEEKGNL
jgi:hypothetical protein